MFLTSLSGASNVHKSLKTTGIASREPLGALTNGNNTRYVFYKDRSSILKKVILEHEVVMDDTEYRNLLWYLN